MTFAIIFNKWNGVWWEFGRHAIRINIGWIAFDYSNIDYVGFIIMQDRKIKELEKQLN